MSDLPAQLVPADVDLRDFAYMPLDVARLRDSDIVAVVNAEAFRAAVILWCAAWHQVPAASLPADEQALSRLAGYGRDVAGWRKAKEGALRGFVLCADNRLYHPVIAEKALHAWEAKQAQRARTAAATAARLAKKQDSARNDKRDYARGDRRHDGRDVQRHEARNEQRDEDVTSTKGEGEGYPRSSLRSDGARASRNAFDREFWPRYPHKVGKPAALKSWERLWREMRGVVAPILCGLERYCRDKPADRPWLNPATFLNQRRFEDQPAFSLSATASPSTSSTPRIDFGGGTAWPETTVLAVLARWKDDPTTWPADRIGPPPGTPGCRVPERLLEAA